MLLWEPFHKPQEEGTKMYLDLCKPITSQKGHQAHALCIWVSTLISTYEGQDLPIQGGESIKGRITEHPLFLYFLAVVSILKNSTCHARTPEFCTGIAMIRSLKENYLFWRCQGWRSQQLWAYEIMTCVFSAMANYTIAKNFKIQSELFSHINLLPQEICG